MLLIALACSLTWMPLQVVVKGHGSSFKLKEGKFRLATRKKFFTPRMLKHECRLSREAVGAPSHDVEGQTNVLGMLVLWKVMLPMARHWTR